MFYFGVYPKSDHEEEADAKTQDTHRHQHDPEAAVDGEFPAEARYLGRPRVRQVHYQPDHDDDHDDEKEKDDEDSHQSTTVFVDEDEEKEQDEDEDEEEEVKVGFDLGFGLGMRNDFQRYSHQSRGEQQTREEQRKHQQQQEEEEEEMTIRTTAVVYKAGDDIPIELRGRPPAQHIEPQLFPPLHPEPPPPGQPQPVAVIIPFFNEEAPELWHTLRDMLQQQAEIRCINSELHICIIMDGWGKASDSMKAYLQRMFPLQVGAQQERITAMEMETSWSQEVVNWRRVVEPNGINYANLAPQLDDEDEENPMLSQSLVTFHRLTPQEKREQMQKRQRQADGYPVTVVVRRTVLGPQGRELIQPVTVYDLEGNAAGQLYLTLIIKKDNRRKHNSHIWFLADGGFAPSTGAQLYFLTDGGTQFESGCLRKLIKKMRNPSYAVVTGRQRVMTAEQQSPADEALLEKAHLSYSSSSGQLEVRYEKKHKKDKKNKNERCWPFCLCLCMSWLFSWIGSLFSLMKISRAAIRFDYEASFASFVGAFALVGFLPVVPGPCGLYRRATLEGKPLKKYFDILEQSPKDTGMVLGNLRLAEDRVLSYAPLLWGEAVEHPDTKQPLPLKMGVCPGATFLFQQEELFKQLVGQRRRWINGTVAGYVWLVANLDLFRKSKRMSTATKMLAVMLFFCQMFMYCVVCLAPMLLFLALRHLIFGAILDVSQPLFSVQVMLEIVWWLVVLLWLIFVVRHAAAYAEIEEWSFTLLGVIGAAISLGSLISFTVFLISDKSPLASSEQSQLPMIAILLLLATGVAPFVVAFVYSPRSCWLMIKSFFFFILFLPTLVAWFGAFAFSRLWQLTWGNRPSDQMSQMDSHTQASVTQRMKERSYIVTALVVLANFVFCLAVELNYARSWILLALAIIVFWSQWVQLALSFIHALSFRCRRFAKCKI